MITSNPTGDSLEFDQTDFTHWNNIFSTIEEIQHYVDEILSREGHIAYDCEKSSVTWYLNQLYAATKCLKQLQEKI